MIPITIDNYYKANRSFEALFSGVARVGMRLAQFFA